MAKLYFRHGAVSSAKTLNLLCVAHNYKLQGKRVVIAKPDIDTRFGLSKVASRAGLHAEADLVLAPDTVLKVEDFKGVACLLVDEVQFLPPEQIDVFRAIANAGTPVIAFGLRTDFRSQLFAGSKRMLELADSIEEVKTTCYVCNRKAIFNLKLANGKATFGGPQIELGCEERYLPYCSFHYFEEKAKCDAELAELKAADELKQQQENAPAAEAPEQSAPVDQQRQRIKDIVGNAAMAERNCKATAEASASVVTSSSATTAAVTATSSVPATTNPVVVVALHSPARACGVQHASTGATAPMSPAAGVAASSTVSASSSSSSSCTVAASLPSIMHALVAPESPLLAPDQPVHLHTITPLATTNTTTTAQPQAAPKQYGKLSFDSAPVASASSSNQSHNNGLLRKQLPTVASTSVTTTITATITGTKKGALRSVVLSPEDDPEAEKEN